MRGKWLLAAVAAIAAGVGGAALSLHWKSKVAASIQKSGAALIQSGASVTVSGKIRPQHVTSVSTDVAGNIDAFQVEAGEEVFEGEVLARIGSSGLETERAAAETAAAAAESEVAKAEAGVASARMEGSRAQADLERSNLALDRARAAYERQQNLFQLGAAPKLVYEKATHDYQSARQSYEVMDKAARLSAEQLQGAQNALSAAQKRLLDRNQAVAEAQNNLQAADVRSPVDGLVVDRHGELGKPPSGSLFEIATDMYALEVVLELEAGVLRHIQPGQSALVLIPDLQSAGIPGQVKSIQGNQVVVEFNSTLAAIRPGMAADVRLKME